ncbi:MAG TPA: Na+/H+ antiporter [Chitinophagaceae bacterium]|nr:Na+/H+ antiporter [Chitinophagaceae bacterium]
MLQEHILLVVCLLLGIALLTMVSNKLKISYPILLVISGLVISFIPGIPLIQLHPDLVFLIFLPPLLYAAAWNTSWRDFWKWRRPIILLAFGLVIFTSAAIAFVSNAIIPGFSLAFGFLLGGIISPPDAVAATSVLQGLQVPKRVVTVLEGESLVNDASSLIVFRFALAAILTGQFHIGQAAGSFALVVVMGITIGISIGWVIYMLHKFFPTTASIDAAITLITPYIMYIIAEHFHFSGVLSVVSGGLFLSFHSHSFFNYETRLQVAGLWETLVFLLNGLVFILIGLQLPGIIGGLGEYSIGEAILYAVIISMVTIIIRVVWVFPSAYLPRWLFKNIRKAETNPGWKNVLLVAWSGMRGVVSLAAALSIPLVLTDGTAFPHRNLILFITFVVILATLVLQGLSLKPLIKLLRIKGGDKDEIKEQLLALRLKLAESVVLYLDMNYAQEMQQHDSYKRVYERYERMMGIARKQLAGDKKAEAEAAFLPQYRQMLIELVHIRRRELQYSRYKAEFSEELMREREWELDLEEARLKN